MCIFLYKLNSILRVAIVPTCSDGVKNQDETDVDCGGSKCGKCDNGKACNVASECFSGECSSNLCQRKYYSQTQSTEY